MSFKELHLDKNIQKAIDACGYNTPTPVQAKSIPPIMAGKDVVASAQTGTGKTAAFVLPALHHLSIQKPSRKTKILVLTPTRELANQITQAASQYGKFMQYKIVNLVGGMPYHRQIRELQRGADIIVATPGRLIDHAENNRVDLSGVEMLVLDEADRMLDMGFIDDVTDIANMTPRHRQTLLFSATIDKQLDRAIKNLMNNPIRIDLSDKKVAAPKIEQHVYQAKDQRHKLRMLRHFLNDENIYKAIIFSATKINADKLANQLRDEGYATAALHGDLKQNARNRTIEQLKKGKIQFLVATDVAARGIDINDVTHVINYDMPRFCEDYVHRIGRTGRAGKEGIAVSFVSSAELKHLQRIERFIGQRLQINHMKGMNEPEEGSVKPFILEQEKKQSNHRHFESRKNRRGDGESRFSKPYKRNDDESRFEKSRKHNDSDNRFAKSRKRNDDDNRFEKSRKRNDDDSRFEKSHKRNDGENRFAKPHKRNDRDSRFAKSHKSNDGDSRFAKTRKNREGFRKRKAG